MASACRRHCSARPGAGLRNPVSGPRRGDRTRPALPAPRPIPPVRRGGSRQPAAPPRRALHPPTSTEPTWRDRAAAGNCPLWRPSSQSPRTWRCSSPQGMTPVWLRQRRVEADPAAPPALRRPACPQAQRPGSPAPRPAGAEGAAMLAAVFAAERTLDRIRRAALATRLGTAVATGSRTERETLPSARSAGIRA